MTPGCGALCAVRRLTPPLNPVGLSRGGGWCQFGRASAPTIPQRVHTIRGPSPRRLLRDHNVGGLDHRQDVVTLLQAEISNVLILIDAVTVFPPPMSMAM
jgi:hypothetical protein